MRARRFNPITVELSYAIGREYQRQGYATEACRALIEYGFKEVHLARLTNGVSTENIPTNRLCQTLNFRQVKNAFPDEGGTLWCWIMGWWSDLIARSQNPPPAPSTSHPAENRERRRLVHHPNRRPSMQLRKAAPR